MSKENQDFQAIDVYSVMLNLCQVTQVLPQLGMWILIKPKRDQTVLHSESGKRFMHESFLRFLSDCVPSPMLRAKMRLVPTVTLLNMDFHILLLLCLLYNFACKSALR